MRLLRLGDQAPISAMITTVPIIPYPNIKILLAAGAYAVGSVAQLASIWTARSIPNHPAASPVKPAGNTHKTTESPPGKFHLRGAHRTVRDRRPAPAPMGGRIEEQRIAQQDRGPRLEVLATANQQDLAGRQTAIVVIGQEQWRQTRFGSRSSSQ